MQTIRKTRLCNQHPKCMQQQHCEMETILLQTAWLTTKKLQKFMKLIQTLSKLKSLHVGKTWSLQIQLGRSNHIRHQICLGFVRLFFSSCCESMFTVAHKQNKLNSQLLWLKIRKSKVYNKKKLQQFQSFLKDSSFRVLFLNFTLGQVGVF